MPIKTASSFVVFLLICCSPLSAVNLIKPKEDRLVISIAHNKKKEEIKLASVWWEPNELHKQKSAIIIVPGYENTSYRAPRTGDGKNIYKKPIDVGSLWQQSFAELGYYVFAYDKRTCSPEYDAKCSRYATHDIDTLGPKAMANDLDKACKTVVERLGKQTKIVLLTENQGTQVMLASECHKRASALVILSPVPGVLDKMWITGLKEAKEDFRAENLEKIFETISNFSITSAKIFGQSTTFWRKWLTLSKETQVKLKKSPTPMLFVIGKDDPTISKEGIKILSKLENKRNKQLLRLENADKNLIADAKISHYAIKRISDWIKAHHRSLRKTD